MPFGVPLFDEYNSKKQVLCGGQFVAYNGQIISQRNVIFDRSKCSAKAKGGEDPLEILKKYSDADEMYHFKPRAFLQPCDSTEGPKPTLTGTSLQLTSWMASTTLVLEAVMPTLNVVTNRNFTIALARYEYANLYWTIMDLYDVFLVMKFFNKTPAETTVLIMDAHPKSHLDALWYYTFGAVHRLGEMDTLVRYDHLVWAMSRGNSPFLVMSKIAPLVKEFRETVWSQIGLPIVKPPVVCSPNASLNILFIWRHNYIAHPRNPSGEVARKIANENELLAGIKERYPNHNITGAQLDNFTIKQQIQLIASTDIMIGMHGAAFAYCTILPHTSVALELFPQGFAANWHMEYLAKWNGVRYMKWKNTDTKLENRTKKMTTIPVHIVAGLISDAQNYLCPPHHDTMLT